MKEEEGNKCKICYEIEERQYRFINEYVIKPRFESWAIANHNRLHPNWPERSEAGEEEAIKYLDSLWKWAKEWQDETNADLIKLIPKEEKE